MGFPTDEVENHGWKLYITSLVMIITAGLFVIARCASRIYFYKFGWDDVAIIVSLASSIVLSVAIQLAVENGYGMHKADLSTTELRAALKFFFIAQVPYKVTVCLNKMSAILLYLRIFVTPRFRIACFIVTGLVVGWSVSAIASTIWQCHPIAGAWNTSLHAKCINSGVFWVAYAIMNVLTDIIVLALPIPLILALQLKMRDRLMICGLFLMGGLVTVTSILRTTSVQNSTKTKSDITWNFIDRGMWTLIEANIGIISACLLVLKQPLAHILPSIFASTPKGSSYYAHSTKVDLSYPRLSIQRSHPGMWRGSMQASRSVYITGPGSPGRKGSDEQNIFLDFKTGPGRDSPSLAGQHGISKTIDLVRTSFHQPPGSYDSSNEDQYRFG
ncbi:hypothetical protein PT974_03789 [Cladobotryum mycophilum]|uniref:Rhodopsin domain-containing protein n=1 Tax=Cladobotryum mycophilum TaxID=491253 RepID=A0ABR0SUH1_9HYPO